MTMRLSLVIDGNATGAKKAADDTTQAVKTTSTAVDKLSASWKTETAEEIRARLGMRQTTQAAQEQATAFRGVAQFIEQQTAASRRSAEATKLNQQQLANLSFQMNDIGVMLASGQSPFVLLMQQGMQIAQLFKPGTGLGAAIGEVGKGIVSFVTNPLNLAVLGFASAAGAATWLWSAVTGGANEAEASLDRHNAIVKEAKALYERAGGSAKAWGDELQRVTRLQAEQNVTERQRDLTSSLGGGAARFAGGANIGLGQLPADQAFAVSQGWLGEEIRQMEALRQQAAAGEISIESYRRQLDAIGSTSADDATRRFALALIEASNGALDLEQALRDAKRARDALNGTLGGPNSRDAETASMAAYEKMRNEEIGAEWRRQRDEAQREAERRSKDAERDAKRHVDELKRLAAAWNDEAAPAVERYNRELAKLDEARPYFESEADYLRARIALQNEMNTAIDQERKKRLDAATDFRSGAIRAFEDYSTKAMDHAATAEAFVTRGFTAMEDAVVKMATGAKVSFADLTNSILADMARAGIRQVTGWAAGLIGNLLGGIGGGAGSALPWSQDTFVASHHTGYGPGDALVGRRLPLAAFANAPRFHTGVGPGERPAVIRDDESVLTPGQMRALGGSRAMTVKLELVSEAGRPVPARNGGSRQEGGVDIQRLIVSAAADDVQADGPLSRALAGTFGLKRLTR